MAELKGKGLEYAAKHMLLCRKHKSKMYRVLVEVDDAANGPTLAMYLKNAYNAEDIKDNDIYKDFSLVFDKVWRRDEVIEDINRAVEEYRDRHPDLIPEEVTETASNKPVTASGKSTNWTIYLIAGAVVAVLIALLWPKKK